MLITKHQGRPRLYTVQTDMSLSGCCGFFFFSFSQISGCFWCLWSACFWSQYCPSNWPVWFIRTNTRLKISQPHNLCGIVQAKENNKTLNFTCGFFPPSLSATSTPRPFSQLCRHNHRRIAHPGGEKEENARTPLLLGRSCDLGDFPH